MSEQKCCAQVRTGGNGFRNFYKDCGRPAKVEHNGKHYCGVHDPVKARAKRGERDNERRARWKAEAEAANRAALCERCCTGMTADALTALADAGGLAKLVELLRAECNGRRPHETVTLLAALDGKEAK